MNKRGPMSKSSGKLNKKIQSKLANLKKTKNIKIKVKSKNKLSATASRSTRTKLNKTTKKFSEKELIIIDEAKGLIFENEKTLFGYFSNMIQFFENKYSANYSLENDLTKEEMTNYEIWLEPTLDDPDEIWMNKDTFDDTPIYNLVKEIREGEQSFYYIASVYLNSVENYPTFVFFHFATVDSELIELFRDKEIIYHRKLESVQFAALEGDSLLEGDFLSIGLLESMLKLRSDKDIDNELFKNYAHLRDDTINNPDEIWRHVSSDGYVLVNFIKDFSDTESKDLHYIVVTEEEPESQVHSLLFSFPTNDEQLLERYRQGENLDADEVSTESSH